MKKINKQCLLDTPRRVTVNNKKKVTHIKMQKVREKICIHTKAMALLRIAKGNYSNNKGP